MESLIDLFLIRVDLERIADQATNIAEDVIYMISSQDQASRTQLRNQPRNPDRIMSHLWQACVGSILLSKGGLPATPSKSSRYRGNAPCAVPTACEDGVIVSANCSARHVIATI